MENLNKTERMSKGLLFFIFFLVIALLIFLIIFLGKEQNTNNEMEGVVNEQNQTEEILGEDLQVNEEAQVDQEAQVEEAPLRKETQTAEELEDMLINRENYLRENISILSSVKEVLGGTFYVTEINWLNDDVAQIKYEDGHIALEAEAFFVNDVAPNSFTITKEN